MATANNPSSTIPNTYSFDSTSPVTADQAYKMAMAALQPQQVTVDVSASYNTTTTQSQVGLNFSTTSSTIVNTELGESVKDMSLLQNIRSKVLHFSAYHLKPLTKLYAFFDNVNVDAYISTAYKVILTSTIHSNPSKAFIKTPNNINVEVLFAKDTTIYIIQSPIDYTIAVTYLTAGATFVWDNITYTISSIVQPTQLEVDENGYVAGSFLIPSTSELSFKTGTRSFLVCDSPSNVGTEISTAAEFNYYASGMAVTKQATTLSTRYNQVEVSPSLKSTTTESATITATTTAVSPGDPIVLDIRQTAVASSGNNPFNDGKMHVIDYILDFTSAIGECGIDVINSLVADLSVQAPDAYQIFWDGSKLPVAGSGGSADKPAFITTGDIDGLIKTRFGSKIGNGTLVKVDHIPTTANPIKYRFNKNKATPTTALLRVTTFGNAGWKQIMPPGVVVVTGSAKFDIAPKDSTFVPANINGITGWEHWTGTWVTDVDHPLDKNVPAHKNWEYKGANGKTAHAEYGEGFLTFPAGSFTKAYVITNSGTGSGNVTGVSVNKSNDLLQSPASSLAWSNSITTSFSDIRVKSGSTFTTATFPVTLAKGESLHFNIVVSWPYTYYSPTFNWNAQGVASPVTTKKIMALKNHVTIIANYKKAVIDEINRMRDYLLRWEVTPAVTNTSVTPNSANIAMKSKSSAITQHDPLAQSFFVNANEHPDGYFVSSVDLFFKAKSPTDDITVQIRPMTNNQFPSATEIVPFAISSLPASSINTTDYPDNTDILSFTKFKFASPIYLSPGSYAIVVISPSKDYQLFTSTIGQFRLNNPDSRISEPSYSGDLFKSSNQMTWLPSPTQDLCFVINRCDFDTSGTVYFKSEKPDTNFAAQYGTAFAFSKAYTLGDYVRVSISADVDNLFEVMVAGTSSATVTPNTLTGVNFTNGSLTLKFISAATRYKDTAIPYDVYFSQGESVVFNNSEAVHYFQGTNEAGQLDTDFTPILLGSNYELESRRVLDSNVKDLYAKVSLSTQDSRISPIIDITRLSNILVKNIVNNVTIAPDFVALATVVEGDYLKTGTTGSYKTYLVIAGGILSSSGPTFTNTDALNGTALLRYMGTSNNGDTELLPAGGLAKSKYMTRKVILANGFESTDIVVRFNANTPAGSTVKVYYKAANIDGSTTLEQTPYYEMVLAERNNAYMTQFVEHKFVCDYATPPSDVRYALLSKGVFNQFLIKIVMLSANTLVVPKIRDLRAIALID